MGLPLSHNISLGIATCLLAQLPLQTLQADHGAMCDAFCDTFQTPLFGDHIFLMSSRCCQCSPKGVEIIPTVPIRQILMAAKYRLLDNMVNMPMHSFQLL